MLCLTVYGLGVLSGRAPEASSVRDATIVGREAIT
jgi:hypothetical protein